MRRVFRTTTATALGVALLIAPTIAAAQSGSAIPLPPASPVAPRAATGQPLPDLDAIFAPTRPPIDLAVVAQPDATVSVVVPVEGGVVRATGADGTVFALTIPADALLAPTEISLTPLVSVTGLPTGSTVSYAAQLAPDGLTLYQDAILVITPPTELPVGEQIAFGYETDGTGMFLAAPVVDDPAIALRISHFSGYGVTRGLLADMASERERLGGSEERRLQSQVAEALGRERQAQLLGAEPDLDVARMFEEAFAEFEAKVVAPRVAAAGKSCANGRLAIETVLGFQRQKSLLGMGGDDFPADLMKTASHICVQEEYELCRDEHIVHRMLPVILGMERQRQLLGADDAAETAFGEDMAQRCLSFKLVLDSTVTVKSKGVKIVSKMKADMPLELTLPYTIDGHSDLVNDDYTMTVPSPCSANNHPTDSTVATMSLSWEASGGSDTSAGAVTDYALIWKPEPTKESATIHCPKMGPLDVTTGMWHVVFTILHQDEIQVGGAGVTSRALALDQGAGGMFQLPDIQPVEHPGPFRTTGWTVAQAELLGELNWSKKNGPISEKGSFELHHTPR